ncbi:MAG: B12-binding domain-containing radical SAM protein [Verrucomicrobia bacterium]|nr:B12-binding domain-containing radical SAM protein [Verrucomicrobiota bacterium]
MSARRRLVLIIEPGSRQLNIFSQFTLPRLGSFLLAGLANRNPNWTGRVFVEGREWFDLDRWISRHGQPDVVCISTITPTANRSYQIADACRSKGIPVAMGGPHVTFMPDEALNHAELVVRGEGEIAFQALLDLWSDGPIKGTDPRYAGVPNLSWKDDAGGVHHNPLGAKVEDLDTLPLPDFSLADGTADCVIGGKRTVVVQTSRGCPFDCSFCSVTAMFGKKLRHRSTASVVEELEKYDTPKHVVFFCDDNFAANKAKARELVEAMLRRGFRFHWSTQVRTDVARDPELLGLMKKSGAHTLFIGFESVNPTSLKEMKKAQQLDEMRAAIETIHRAGIHIHGMFVLGFESDDTRTAEETVKFIQRMKLTSAQLLILTPLPGTELHKQLTAQRRIVSQDWDLYDAHHVVFRPRTFTPCELQYAQVNGHTRLYSLPQVLKKIVTGRFLSASLSLYAWQINRRWQKDNAEYLAWLRSSIENADD